MHVSKEQSKENPRQQAVVIIHDWIQTHNFPDRTLNTVTSGHAFVMEIVLGIVRYHRTLSWIIGQMLAKTPRTELVAVLEVGLYQILFMDNAEDYASIHETVELVKSTGSPQEVCFVNALLRRAQREKEEIKRSIKQQPIGIQYSYPDLLTRRWKDQFGERNMRLLCEWNNRPAETVLRINRRRTNLSDFQTLLSASNITAQPHPFMPRECLILSRGLNVRNIPGYEEGMFYVQNPATTVAVKLLDVQSGQTILDACAAPGGKMCVMAERLQNQGQLIALDLYEDRLAFLRNNVKRLRLENVRVQQADATGQKDDFIKKLNLQFDRILLDVPCTNTGVIRRRPDVRWRFSLKRMQGLMGIQKALLNHTSTFLKSGGKLVYSTCSLESEENEEFIQGWLNEHPELRFAKAKKIFPPRTSTDGAYAVLLEKK
ncbi:MAG: 16S rRNA (cytosine(967)-C(5))-methyltransferase RsmB [Kiritimatiellae bacterium]|nr:16S rRNA (cytosine(967)-C(5))-methyltransferase RsmB [Kiritimatiellia bacterium]